MKELLAGVHPDRIDLRRLLKTLGIGALGGLVFFFFELPLAWMLGAMVLTTLCAVGGIALSVPTGLRASMVMVLGVLLGSTFSPDVFDHVAAWPVTLGCLALYLATATGLLYLYFARVLGFDPVTAYFSATPGGMSEMVITGADAGGDERTIALVHGARVLLVVMALPMWFRYGAGENALATTAGPPPAGHLGLTDVVILLACIPLGLGLGRLLRLPAYRLVGPMLVSAAAHISGLTASSPPEALVALAQIVVGASVGARFAGVSVRRLTKTLVISLGSTTLMLSVTVGFAFVLSRLTAFELPPLVLAFSPGGLTEMSLVALALGVETAFVATHHIVRITIIVLAAPLVFRIATGKRRTRRA